MEVTQDPVLEFSNTARAVGLILDNPVCNGKLQRCKTKGDKSGNKNGWYVLHLDNIPAGSFGNWKTNEKHTWCARPTDELTPAERAELQRCIDSSEMQRKKELTKRHAEAQTKATAQWNSAETIDENYPYITNKKIHPYGAKQSENKLVIPIRDIDGVLHSLQFIDAEGTKRFLPGGRKHSCFATLGDKVDSTLYLAEGWATGCTIHQATELTVIVAFDAGNLLPVAETLRKRYPDVHIIICADDDFKTPGNPGLTKATEAARTVNGLLAIPSFDNNRPADATDFNDLLQHSGLDAVCQCLVNATEVSKDEPQPSKGNDSHKDVKNDPAISAESWGPILLPSSIEAPDIPADILPSRACNMVEAIAADTQTSPAASVLLTLSVVATCVQRRFEVAPRGDHSYRETLSLWTLTALPSGSRKSPILRALSGPLKQWRKLMAVKLRPDISTVNATRKVAKKRIERLETKAGSTDDRELRDSIRDEIKDEIEAMPDEIKPPRLITGDTTPERLQEMLAEYGESMTLLSDEAGIFQVMGGLYSGGQAVLDTFLQAYSGDSIQVDRKSRTAHIARPALSFGLIIQPAILQSVANNKQFHDSGLLARFLFCIPHNTVGNRDVRAYTPIPDDVSTTWRERLFELLDGAETPPTDPKILSFTPEAKNCWQDFSQKVENELISTGKLGQMTEWGAKLPGQCARIAGLMELISTGRDAEVIQLDSVQRAVKLCGFLVQHAKITFRLLGADEVESNALYLMAWIKAKGHLEFDRRVVQKALEGKFRKVTRLMQAAERLYEWNVLSQELKRTNKGARPTIYYRANPLLFQSSP